MKSAVTIKKNFDIKLESYEKSFLNPKHIFLPIEEKSKLKVQDGVSVYKNDIVMINRDGTNVRSSVSGVVLGVKDMTYADGKVRPSLVIENDFKENVRIKNSVQKYINQISKDDFNKIMEDVSLYRNGDFVINKFKGTKDVLIINGIEREPYFGNRYFTLRDNTDDILETIDYLSETFKFKETILAVKNTDSSLITKILDLMGTYPNIELKLMQGDYPLGINTYLEETLGYTSALVLDVGEIWDIKEVLRRQDSVDTKLITITGDAVTPRAVIRVKIGSLLSEVFVNNFDFTAKSVDVYLNGIMKDNIVNTLNYVVSDSLDGIQIMEKGENTIMDCLNCGLCHKNCPRDLNPKYVCDHMGRVKFDYKKGCLQCGLCNYVCPANRDLMKYMKEVSDE